MDPLLIVARALHFAATIALFGVFAWERFVLPAVLVLGDGGDGGESAARHRRWLAASGWASLALSLLSGAAWLLAVSAEISGRPLGAVLAQGIWTVVLTRTRFGTDWVLRFALAMLLAGCLSAAPRRLGRAAATGWAGLAFAAALLGSLAWAGHGAATPGAPGLLHLAADVVHLLAAGLWLGLLPPLALLLTAAWRAHAPAGLAMALVATRRFGRIAVASVAALFAGGLVNTWFLAGTVPALVGTTYGRLLLLKIALFLALLTIAAVNRLRLTPRLDAPGGNGRARRALCWLRRNAAGEAVAGLAILTVVAVLGALPPGLHTEPGWPFPFRLELAVLANGAKILAAALAAVLIAATAAAVAAAAAGRYRRAMALAGLAVVIAGAGWLPLRPAVEPAYPTSFYAPTEPYAAASVIRGAAVYAENCALCHGESGRGDGPAATGLAVRPADLTAPHLFAHTPGDLFWWISRGKNSVMPGFGEVLRPRQRWDVINFIDARAAGVLARGVGPQISGETGLVVPDFAFASGGEEHSLDEILGRGPVLLALFTPPAPAGRLAALAAAQSRLKPAEPGVIAVAMAPPGHEAGPLVADVSADVAAALALFRAPDDGGETELLLDRGGNIRARWTASGDAALPDPAILAAAAERVAQTAVAAPAHSGHAH